jgi:subtilisin
MAVAEAPHSRKAHAAKTPAAEAGMAATESKRPNYIVIFQKPSERNASTLSKVLKVKEARGVASTAGTVLFAARSDAEPRPRLYERLGVAATDLTGAEVSELRSQDVVAAIVPNVLRHIPPLLEDGQTGPVGVATHSSSGLGFHALTAGVLAGDAPMAAYLMGMRDAAELALRLMFPGASLPGMPVLPALPSTLLPTQVGAASHSWCLTLIGIGPDFTGSTGKGVKVAVLDTGIDLEHPDFAGRFPGGNNTASFIAGQTIQDGHGHGTHCAGIIAGPAQSTGGRRYGVAPGAELLIAKVLNDQGNGYDDQILDGIAWAADAGARVISMSLGSAREMSEPFSDLYEVVAENLLNEGAGTLIVAAAGNESNRPAFTKPVGNPAACPSLMAVAAIGQDRQVGWFSCRQMDEIGKLAISAPGVQVYSSWTGKGFKTISGTSMATPHVAGVAALYLQEQPTLKASELVSLLRTRAESLGDPKDFGNGLVQVNRP